MLIFVFSDSHGTTEHMEALLEKELPDMVIHLGDHAADAKRLASRFPMPLVCVAGNSYDDLYSGEQDRVILRLEGHKMLLCHGHRYHVKSSLLALGYAAASEEAELVLYGHTHIPADETASGVRFINPGSAGRGYLRGNTYARLTVTAKDITCKIERLPDGRNRT